MIWLSEYKKEPGKMNYITDIRISHRLKQANDYGINPKFYSSEKELFRYEIINIVRLRQEGQLSGAYDNVLDSIDAMVLYAHKTYPELLL